MKLWNRTLWNKEYLIKQKLQCQIVQIRTENWKIAYLRMCSAKCDPGRVQWCIFSWRSGTRDWAQCWRPRQVMSELTSGLLTFTANTREIFYSSLFYRNLALRAQIRDKSKMLTEEKFWKPLKGKGLKLILTYFGLATPTQKTTGGRDPLFEGPSFFKCNLPPLWHHQIKVIFIHIERRRRRREHFLSQIIFSLYLFQGYEFFRFKIQFHIQFI